uniref:RNA helicase n=1 Tax=Parastrongyloides trichosuri TaxID=131310 RepID=A0A0N4ZEL1_PARTI
MAFVKLYDNGHVYNGCCEHLNKETAKGYCLLEILNKMYRNNEQVIVNINNDGKITKKRFCDDNFEVMEIQPLEIKTPSQYLSSQNKGESIKILDVDVTVENALSILNMLYSKEGKGASNFDAEQIPTYNNESLFEAKLYVNLDGCSRDYYSEGYGRSKKIAKNECAFNVLKQMYENKEYITSTKRHILRNSLLRQCIKIENDDAIFKDLKALYNFLEINLPEFPIQENEFDSNYNIPINPKTFFSIKYFNEEIKKTFHENKKIDRGCSLKGWFPPKSNYNCWSNSYNDCGKFQGMELGEISRILLARENSKIGNEEIENTRIKLPVYMKQDEIIKTISENQAVLIKSNTGSGKSTQIAQFLLKNYILNGKGAEFNCIITQPRRLSAISLAKRVAEELGEKVGDSIGYCVRFDKVDPRPYGSIMYGTIGSILKKLSTSFRGVSHIILDEVHERSLETDFLLIILKKMMMYADLKVILMSATIDTKEFEDYIDDLKVIELKGTTYEIKDLYLDEFIQYYKIYPSRITPPLSFDSDINEWTFENIPKGRNISPLATYFANEIEKDDELPYEIIQKMVEASVNLMFESKNFGSILIFVPGWIEIINCLDSLSTSEMNKKFWLLPLHSNLPPEEQVAVFNSPPQNKIKIIVSTNIAESSITIDDVLYVIDSCKQKSQMIHHETATCIFKINWTSQDCMEQRKGRAGRLRQGYCYRLLTRKLFNSLPKHTEPEIKTAPLHSSVLEIKSLGLQDSYAFLNDGMEKIDERNIREAEEFLQQLSALDQYKNITHTGRILQRLPFSPDIAKCVLTGALFNMADPIAIISGFSSSSLSLFKSTLAPEVILGKSLELCGDFQSDHILPLVMVNKIREKGTDRANNELMEYINFGNIKYLESVEKQIISVLKNEFPHCVFNDYKNLDTSFSCAQMHVLISLLVKSCYPNIALQTGKKSLLDNEGFKVNSNRTSVISNEAYFFKERSPFVIYSQKVVTKFSMLKECSVVSPLHILLFGCSNVVYKGGSEILLDKKYTFEINPKFAQMIIFLKTIIDSLLQSLCTRGYLSEKELAIKHMVRNLVERICTMEYSINGRTFKVDKVMGITKVNFQEIGGITNWI